MKKLKLFISNIPYCDLSVIFLSISVIFGLIFIFNVSIYAISNGYVVTMSSIQDIRNVAQMSDFFGLLFWISCIMWVYQSYCNRRANRLVKKLGIDIIG